LDKTAVILAGGSSKRLREDKGLIKLAGKPLILHVIDRISNAVDEVIIVVGSEDQKKDYSCILKSAVKIITDKYDAQSPIVGALTGFENAKGKYSLLLPCDTPFISSEIASLLLELCINTDAVVPRWPSGYLEPLQACYRTKSSLVAARKALKDRRLDIRSMISHLKKVTYLPTTALEQIDPKLMTFFNVNTPEDLKKAELTLKQLFHRILEY